MAKAKAKKTCAWPGCDRDISDRGARAVRCKEHAAEWTRNRSRRAAGSEGREVNGDATAWRAEMTQSTRVDSVSETALLELPLGALAPSGSRAQASRRGRFEAEGIAELAASIRSVGIVEPLVVRDERAGIGFEIVAGERRWLAAKEAGLETVPCIVRQWDDERAAVAQLVENLQRVDVDALAEAEGYGTLVRQHGWEPARVAKEIGRSKSHVYGRLQLLDLAKGCRQALADGEITVTVGRTLCRVPESLQDDALKALREEQDNYTDPLTTREIEDVIDWNFRRRIEGEPEDVGFDPQAKLAALAFGGEMPAVDSPLRACTGCEWNTSHNRALGGRKGMCAHPACHAHKQYQHADALASAFEGEVVLATAKNQFATTTNTTPNRAKYVSDGWEIESLRRRAKRPLPDALFVCKDPARQGPRAFKVLLRGEAEAALPEERGEQDWKREKRKAEEAVARVADLTRPLFEGEPTAEQEAALLRFVVQEFRLRAWSSTMTRVGQKWKGAKSPDVPLASLCPDDAALRRFMLDLALAQAFDSQHRDGAEAFAEACGLPAAKKPAA